MSEGGVVPAAQPPSAPSRRVGVAFLRAYPPFTRLWAGQLVSRLGDSLDTIAFLWVVLELTGSTLVMGSLMVANMLPSILLTPVAGVWVDRWPRRAVMIVTDLGRALTTALLAGLYVSHQLAVWHLFALSVANSVLEAFEQPARAAVVPLLVEERDLVSANSIQTVASSMASLFGLVAAAPILAWLGIAWAIAIDAATFVFSGLTAMATSIPELRGREHPEDQQADASKLAKTARPVTVSVGRRFLNELGEGLRLVRARRILAYLIVLAGLTNFALGPLNVLLPVHVKEGLGLGVEQLANVYIGIAVGMLLSGYLVGYLGKRLGERQLLGYGIGLVGVAYAALYFGHGLSIVVALAAVMGGGVPMAQAGLQTLVQKNTPTELLGRVSALMGSLGLAAMPLSVAVAGAVAEWVSVPVVFGGMGLFVLLALAMVLTRPEWRGSVDGPPKQERGTGTEWSV